MLTRTDKINVLQEDFSYKTGTVLRYEDEVSVGQRFYLT